MAARKSAGGSASSVQRRKSTGCSFSSSPAAMVFGGVPMMVPMPPRFAATARPSSRLRAVRESSGRPCSAGRNITSSRAVVAVFDMNMLSTKVRPMSAGSSTCARPPDQRITCCAKRLSMPVRVAAAASTSPPKNSHIGGLAQGCTNISQPFVSSAASSGPPGLPSVMICSPMISSATAKAGIASVIHKPAPSITIASDQRPASASPA